MSDDVMREPCPYFQETRDKVRNNESNAKDPYRFVKRARCAHMHHPCNGPPTIGVAPRCQGDMSKCEIPDIWQI
jgi:hypothetical protein